MQLEFGNVYPQVNKTRTFNIWNYISGIIEWFIDVKKFPGGVWWMVGGVGVGKWVENDFGVQTEQAIYDWIDTGTIWTKWWRTEGQSEI